MFSVLKALWRARDTAFWQIWSALTVAEMCMAWIVTRLGTRSSHASAVTPAAGGLTPDAGRPRRDTTAWAMLAVFLAAYVVISVWIERVAFYDDIQLTLYSLKGLSLPPPIWRESGRFFPLGLQEFNFLSHISRSIAAYHVLLVAQILIVAFVLLRLNGDLAPRGRAALVAVFLIAPGMVIAFMGLIYPERNFVFCLVCLIYCVKRFEETSSAWWAAAAAGFAQIMVYEKETASLLLLTFAMVRLILRWWSSRADGRGRSWIWAKESRLDLCLASVSVVFLLYYVAVMFPHPNTNYANRVRFPLREVLGLYLKLDFLAWIFVGLTLVRAAAILRRKVAPSLLWDSLALGGVICFVAYLRLGIYRAYYLAPVETIAVLYLGRLLMQSWKTLGNATRMAAAAVASLVVLQYSSLSAFHVLERQNLLNAKADIARVVQQRYAQAGRPLTLYFPYASPWQVMEFGCYLNLRGVPVETEPKTSPDGQDPVRMAVKEVSTDGRCEPYWDVVCRARRAPESGDLVIVLPDDGVRFSDVTAYHKGGVPLLSYERRPAIPEGIYPLVRLLGVASTPVAQTDLSDHWMDASVTLWR